MGRRTSAGGEGDPYPDFFVTAYPDILSEPHQMRAEEHFQDLLNASRTFSARQRTVLRIVSAASHRARACLRQLAFGSADMQNTKRRDRVGTKAARGADTKAWRAFRRGTKRLRGFSRRPNLAMSQWFARRLRTRRMPQSAKTSRRASRPSRGQGRTATAPCEGTPTRPWPRPVPARRGPSQGASGASPRTGQARDSRA